MSRRNGGIVGPVNTPVGGIVVGSASGVWRMNDVLTFVSNNQWPKGPENIENSCRFSEPSSDNLSRSISSTGNTKIVTFSAWIKRGVVAGMAIFSTGSANTDDFTVYMPSESIQILARQSSSTVLNLYTNRVLRDVSAWYHVVAEIDTTQSTESDRAKLYINGVRETSFSTETYPSQNQDLRINESGYTNYVGNLRGSGNHFDGYMAEIVLIDGQALDPTSFGEFDSTTGIWKPKKIGAIANAGTNSFYLNFKDSSNVGKDESGLGNNFTVNNLTSVDQSTDTCVENFATLNPNHRGTALGDASFSEGNLKHQGTTSGGNYPYSFSTIAASQGKWYAEFKVASDPSTTMIGIASGIADSFLGGTGSAKGYALYGNSGNLFESGSGSSYGSALSVGDILGVAMDLDNNKLYFSKNGTFHNSGDPTSGSTGTGAVSITAPADNGTGVYHFACGKAGTATTSIQANFGAPSFSISSGNSDANGFGNFEYAVPSGYYALNTSNLNTYG